ncbi:unnamed protein product [Effrenium voratum]|uniref:EF-hand domain-containing protein n=1 Tax=Effrenium voratum TaxID=2562239 RepID=A0AA36I5U9_9DINO|nr:unnamed protein product [Effrenium voratum]CAJ1381651.1 unnamed protein product [Effrenium voratum]|mmetsp:Transcript_110251/g.262761  ORF Transcript_110251/g.262761 Transcript_110251/m.262761 type:complete len:608 (+) Transcript_110251:38-1861(+)
MGLSSSRPCECSRGVSRILNRSGESSSSCTLRIVQITDVYVLDNFPSLRTLIKEKTLELERRCGGQTISMLTGDFLAPYLLSSIDMGIGMMKMCNGTPIDYLTWGNHEDDIPHKEVMKREREYTGVWINTNMQSHESFKDSTCQVAQEVIQIASRDGTNKRKVGLMGVLSNSPSLYRPGAFGGAKIEDPWETMATYKKKLEQKKACDVVVPLCHLYEPQDERTCREFDFPVILSGHDHHVVDRMVEGTRLLKPGQDGIKAVILDLSWPNAGASSPVIEYEIVNVCDWPPDEGLKKVAEDAYKVLDPLRRTELARVPSSYRPLTSVQSRGQRVSMGTFLLSRIRDALNMDMPLGEKYVDCALLKGGNIRGGREYSDDDHINLEVLQTEIEEAKQILVIPVPGSVLRVGLRETFGAPNPGWMQYDDEVELDEEGYVVRIAGEPLDPKRKYKVASIVDFWRKRDAPSIGQYFEDHPEELPELDGGRPVHSLLLNFFAMQLWARIWKELGLNICSGDENLSAEAFKALDADGDGTVSKADLKLRLAKVSGFENVFEGMDVLVDNMLGEIAKFGAKDKDKGLSEEALQAAAKHWSSRSLASLVDSDSESEKA